jgi:acyl-coenzyme A synthetase/AMP-(fatty) acid ligase
MEFTYDVTMFKETFENEFTYINGFMRNVHRFSNNPALTCPLREKSWTYSELNSDVNRLANALLADGIKKNDVVMYQLMNCAEFVFCYLAPQKLGAINSPINFRLASGETALIIDDSKPEVFMYDAEIREASEKALAMAKHKPKRVIMVDIWDKEQAPEGYLTYSEYIRGRSDENPDIINPSHIYDENTRLYTSGTTGLPKGVPLNNINDVLSAHDVIMHFPLSQKDKTMNMSPWFHRGGLHSGGPNPTFYVGGEVIILRQFNTRVCLEYAENYGVTFLMGAPSMLKLIYNSFQKSTYDLSKLRGIVSMGAPLDKEDCLKYQRELTQNIYNGYGTSETFWNAFLRPYDLPDMAGTAGRSCTDDDVAVVKVFPDRRTEPNELVEKDNKEIGEIILKCPTKTTYSYYNNPEANKKAFYKGYMYTGDLGIWDKDEFVTIVGRRDDMVICSGENIHPVQIEEILSQHPKVKDCIVTSVSDKLRGEVIVAYIIKSDDTLTAKELYQYCIGHPMMAVYKRPRYFRFTDELPYTATGKKMHYVVKQMAAEDKDKGLLERA